MDLQDRIRTTKVMSHLYMGQLHISHQAPTIDVPLDYFSNKQLFATNKLKCPLFILPWNAFLSCNSETGFII